MTVKLRGMQYVDSTISIWLWGPETSKLEHTCSSQTFFNLQVEAHESYLSELWMSAIRDHALLALPPSFATQLPPNGGTFYCADTIDSSRPHYRRTWPSILHAAAMWLNKHPFRKEMDKITDMTNEDRLFLSIGKAIFKHKEIFFL